MNAVSLGCLLVRLLYLDDLLRGQVERGTGTSTTQLRMPGTDVCEKLGTIWPVAVGMLGHAVDGSQAPTPGIGAAPHSATLAAAMPVRCHSL